MTTPLRNVLEAKKATRDQVLSRRDAIEPTARQARSLKLCHQLQAILEDHFAPKATESDSPLIALYTAMKSEVDLDALAQSICDHGWTPCYPIMLHKEENLPDQSGSMAFFALGQKTSRNRDQCPLPAQKQNAEPLCVPPSLSPEEILAHPLRRHSKAELEEAGFTYVAPSTLDAVIVPLVAFDDQNFRLGYGGGNYDNFLPQLRENCLIVGVAFEEQRIDAVPKEPHDLPLPSILAG